MRLERNSALLVVIDVQERLMPTIADAREVEQNIARLVRGTALMGVPALLTEQYVKGLGPTVSAIRLAFEETSGYAPIEKSCFSAHRCEPFATKLAALGRRQVLLTGVETHVCVYQTARDLLERGLEVILVADALSSRTVRNRDIALSRLAADGARIASTEMVLFDLLGTSGTDEFRQVLRLVK